MAKNSNVGLDTVGNSSRVFQRIGVWAGITGPLLFTVLVIVESLLRQGYSQAYNNISDLSVGSYGIIQHINFIVFGLLILVFALALRRGLGVFSMASLGSEAVSGFGVIIAGVSLIVGAYFLHLLATFAAFISLVAAEFFTWRALRRSPQITLGRYRAYSLISGILSFLFPIVFTTTLSIAYPAGYTSGAVYPIGASERLFAAVPLIWIVATAAKIRSANRISERTK